MIKIKSINELKQILPIVYDNRIISLLKFSDLDEYICETRKKYYNTHLDFKITDVSEEKWRKGLSKTIENEILNIPNSYASRLIIRDSQEDSLVGGINIMEHNDGVLELSYFTTEEYQGNNESYKALDIIMRALATSNIDFTMYKLDIQNNNKASLRIANKLKFTKTGEYKGRYRKNIQFFRNRSEIDIE